MLPTIWQNGLCVCPKTTTSGLSRIIRRFNLSVKFSGVGEEAKEEEEAEEIGEEPVPEEA